MREKFDYEFLDKLIVGIGEVSRITGIDIRKLRYWEQKELISSLPAEDGQTRRFDYKNIKKILLIKELLNEGYTLEAAHNKVEARITMLQNAFGELQNDT